jgi:hypothetical protein
MGTYIEGELPNDEITVRQGNNGVLVREEKREFTVVADNPFENKLTILETPGLPTFGQIVNGMTVRSMNADREGDHQYRWKVAIGLSSEVSENSGGNNGGGVGGGDPTTWKPIASVTFESYQVGIRRSITGRLIANSAGDPFSNALSMTRRIACVKFSQFESISTQIDTFMERSDTVNSVQYKSREPGTLLLTIDDAQVVQVNGYRLWRVDYLMKYRYETWIEALLDQGPSFKDGTEKKQFFREQWNANDQFNGGVEGLTPFEGLLDGNGKPLPNPAKAALEGKEIYQRFKVYREKDFNDFLKVVFTA